MSIEERFGQRVRELRTGRGWSQEKLAEEMTVRGFQLHQTQVGKIESGARPVHLGEVHMLADVLGVALTDLIAAEPMAEPVADPYGEGYAAGFRDGQQECARKVRAALGEAS